MPAITIGPRVRKSPFYDATIRHGALSFTIYNHTFMPTSYETDPEVEYSKIVNGVQIWDVGCERQVQITGPDTMTLAQLLTPRNLAKCAVGQCKYLLNIDQNGGIINDPVIQSTIFPSAHVAAATATALALMRVLPVVGVFYLVIAIGIALGSVFGRYHYAADSILGVLVGVAGFALAGWLWA